MKCSGCGNSSDMILRENHAIAICRSCTRVIDQAMLSLRWGRNPLRTVNIDILSQGTCHACNHKTGTRSVLHTLCGDDLLDALRNLGVELDNNPWVFELVKDRIEWNKRWAADNSVFSFGLEDALAYWPRGENETVIRFDRLLGKPEPSDDVQVHRSEPTVDSEKFLTNLLDNL
jgi:hypothetical protein